jgi:hypothetical protein
MGNIMRVPAFAMGTLSELESSLQEGGYYQDLTTILFCYLTDTEPGGLAFVTPTDKKIHRIKGSNIRSLQSLPDISEGDTETLYIVDHEVYSFDGTGYYPTFHDLSIEVTELSDTVAEMGDILNRQAQAVLDLNNAVEANSEEVRGLRNVVDGYTQSIQDLQDITEVHSRDISDLQTFTQNMSLTINEHAVQISDKANKANTLAGYNIEDAYTKNEVDTKFSGTVDDMVRYVNNAQADTLMSANTYADSIAVVVEEV